ncbi:MAG: SOS response-associated peptidase family protein [Phenylobacterium sp.]|uniref:SOS response-associated peptidase family protein n=1 Tax=Phenylobacterium sp. TaxID=1871053 RepID=UPI001A528D15|nr:SOS response-associated peptidase family protein [Phenylobacterium sp.]MBL8554974.1 SOS response-associated peptidase family protein [Phenylobacterium sp.]
MCNEYALERSLEELLSELAELQMPLGFDGARPNMEPRPSIRPTDPSYLLVGDGTGGARLTQRRWGFPGPRGPVINFRSEGRSFPKGRCLAPADAFFEFTGAKAPKSKWRFESADRPFLAIAGFIRDDRFTLLTTGPGPDIAPYHDRQIVIFPRERWADWLDTARPQPPIGPLPAGSLKVTQIR